MNGSAIVLAADNAYAQGLAVTLLSIARHGDTRDIPVLVLSLGLSPASWQKVLAPLPPAFRKKVQLVDIHDAELGGFEEHGHFSRAAFLRVLIPEILSRQFSKALYLDTDLIVKSSLRPLLETDLGNHYLAAARDWIDTFGNPAIRFPPDSALGVNHETPYFNSGVLLFNLPLLRASDWKERIFSLAERYPYLQSLADQTLINLASIGKILELDQSWNTQTVHRHVLSGYWPLPYRKMPPLEEAKIFHFCTDQKPWFRDCDVAGTELYRELLAETPWGNEVPAAAKRFFLPVLEPTIVSAIGWILEHYHCPADTEAAEVIVHLRGISPEWKCLVSRLCDTIELTKPVRFRLVEEKPAELTGFEPVFLAPTVAKPWITEKARPEIRRAYSVYVMRFFEFGVPWNDDSSLLLASLLHFLWVQPPYDGLEIVIHGIPAHRLPEAKRISGILTSFRTCGVKLNSPERPALSLQAGSWNAWDYVSSAPNTRQLGRQEWLQRARELDLQELLRVVAAFEAEQNRKGEADDRGSAGHLLQHH